MASFRVMAFLVVLVVLLPLTALGEAPAPSPLATYYEHLCDEVECGKGTCIANISYPFNYICQCEPGWTRTKGGDDDVSLLFLPCVIPNCTLNYSCQPAPPPVPQKVVPLNMSAFDPCYWTYCGEGTCNKSSTYTHTCNCNPGFSNLLNVTYFPCYSQCTLGQDCASLGIAVSNTEASPPTGTTTGSPATSFLPGKFQWMTILVISMVVLL